MTINHIIPGLVAVGIALVAGCATTPDDSKRSEAIYNAPEPVLGSSLLRRERRTEGVTEVKGDAAIEDLRRLPTGGTGKGVGN